MLLIEYIEILETPTGISLCYWKCKKIGIDYNSTSNIKEGLMYIYARIHIHLYR